MSPDDTGVSDLPHILQVLQVCLRVGAFASLVKDLCKSLASVAEYFRTYRVQNHSRCCVSYLCHKRADAPTCGLCRGRSSGHTRCIDDRSAREKFSPRKQTNIEEVTADNYLHHKRLLRCGSILVLYGLLHGGDC